MKKKTIIIACVVVALLILLVPIPMRLKDGGSVVYQAVLYSVKNVHRLNPDMESGAPYKEGIIIKVLGVKIFDNVHDVVAGDDLKLDENIGSITVEYMGGGQIKKWSVSKELIDDMIEWVADLDYKEVQFEEGRSPADGEGEAVYSLEFSDGTKFAYYNCGTKHYIRMADTWYQVKNPKLPPAGEPKFEIGAAAKITVLSGTTGDQVEITDTESIQYITDNINGLTYSKGEKVNSDGWNYALIWYDMDGNEQKKLTVLNEYTVIFDGRYYKGMEADYEIDLAFLKKLFDE